MCDLLLQDHAHPLPLQVIISPLNNMHFHLAVLLGLLWARAMEYWEGEGQ